MPEENEQNTEESTKTPADEQPKDDSQAGDKPADEQPEDESGKESEEDESGKEGGDDLPDWARNKLTKANTEAATYRTRLREAEKALENAKSLDEVDEIISSLKAEREESERALLIENVALKFKLPEKAQKRLTGKTREELEADAKELADLFGTDDEDEYIDLEGGLNPRNKDPEANLSPRELAARFGRGSKRRR